MADRLGRHENTARRVSPLQQMDGKAALLGPLEGNDIDQRDQILDPNRLDLEHHLVERLGGGGHDFVGADHVLRAMPTSPYFARTARVSAC